MNFIPKDLQEHWSILSPILSIHNESQYDQALDSLEILLEEVGEDEQHPLYGLLDTLGTVIHSYEEAHHPIPESQGPEVLTFLLQEHQLTSVDLPEIGTASQIDQIVAGERELTAGQIRLLANRFQVSAAVFI